MNAARAGTRRRRPLAQLVQLVQLAQLALPALLVLTLAASAARAQDSVLDEARAQRRAGQLSQASATLRRGLTEHPGDPELEGLLGVLLLEQGDLGAARELAARHADSASYRAQVLVGQVALADGDAAAAVEAFQRAGELKPRPLEALRGQIDAFLALDRPGKALTRARQLAELQASLGAEQLARVYSAQGDDAMQQGAEMLAVAIGRYQLALEQAPDDREIVLRLLEALVVSTRLEPARALAASAFAAEQDRAEAAYWRGRCHDAARELPAARAAFREAWELDPTHGLAALHLARLALADDLHDEARHWLALSRAQRPDTARSLVLEADLSASLGELDEAERSLRRAMALEPRNAGALYQLARVLLRQGRRDEGAAAMAAFRALQKANQPPVDDG